jgi:plasmid maintenance system antidote protein VapI
MEPRGISILDAKGVRTELKRVGLNQRQLAERVGMREATVSDAIRGKPCAPDTIFRLALGLSIAEPVR